MATNSFIRRDGRRPGATTRGYGATLQPAAQITRTLDTMKVMRGGDDLRNWSQSARKELLQGGTAILLVKKAEDTGLMAHEKKDLRDEYHFFAAPKLTVIVASPLLRDYFTKNPTKSDVKVLHSKVTPDAIRAITDWTQAITTSQKTFSIPMVDDLSKALDIRVAAQVLGMDAYVDTITKRYTTGVYKRHPTVPEARIVLEHLIDEEDDTLHALAGRLAHLRRANKFSLEEIEEWTAFCAREEGRKLWDAINQADTRLKEKREQEAKEFEWRKDDGGKEKKGKKNGGKKPQ